jgi:hypothetical protein
MGFAPTRHPWGNLNVHFYRRAPSPLQGFNILLRPLPSPPDWADIHRTFGARKPNAPSYAGHDVGWPNAPRSTKAQRAVSCQPRAPSPGSAKREKPARPEGAARRPGTCGCISLRTAGHLRPFRASIFCYVHYPALRTGLTSTAPLAREGPTAHGMQRRQPAMT